MWQPHHLTVSFIGGKDAGAHAADVLGQAHHEVLTDRVDGGVSNLGKLLPEVVEEYLRTVAEHGQRRVVAHGGRRLLPIGTHGYDGAIDILLAEAKLYLATCKVIYGIANAAPAVQFLQLYAVGAKPLAVGVLLGQSILNLAIVVDFSLLGIDKQYLTRLQPALLGNLRGVEVHDTHLAGHHHGVVLGDGIARRAQSVAVQHASGKTAVAEQQGGRAVPGLHEDGVILVEGLEVFADGVLVIKALGHHNSHGMGQREAAPHEELEHVVEAGRVAHAGLDDGRNLADVAQGFGRQYRLAGLHPSTVAADSVNLAIVAEQAERLGQAPRGERVGRETAVNQGQTTGKIGVGKVGVILAQLEAGEHALVDDVLTGERADVEVATLPLGQVVGLPVGHAPLYLLANNIEGALEGGLMVVGNAGDEHLAYGRLGAQRRLAQALRTGRHRTQVHKRQPLALYLLYHNGQDGLLGNLFLGQEDQAGAILALLGHGDTL